MKLSSMATDLQAEINGVWLTYMDDFQVRVARLSSAGYQNAVRPLVRENRRLIPAVPTERDVRELIAPAVAQFIILDWRNLRDGDSEVLYSVAKATEILLDRRFDDFYGWVLVQANSADNYRAESLKKDLGK